MAQTAAMLLTGHIITAAMLLTGHIIKLASEGKEGDEREYWSKYAACKTGQSVHMRERSVNP